MAGDSISRIDFPGTEFRVVQSLIRNKYNVYDGEDNLILKAKQKMFKMKEEFPFTDPEGNVVFRIKAAKMMDIAGDYSIIDEETGEEVATLVKKFTFLKHFWTVKDPDTEEEWARIESGSKLLELLRGLSSVLSFIPHKYTIEDPEGKPLGRIEGQFNLKDTYSVKLEREDTPNKEAILAAAITIDALEGN